MSNFMFDDVVEETAPAPVEEKKEEKIFTYNEALDFNRDQLKMIKSYSKQLEAISGLVDLYRSRLPEDFLKALNTIHWKFPLV